MMVKSEDINSEDRQMIKCHFCEEIQAFLDNGRGFPVDKRIPLLLNIKHCTENETAKMSFKDVAQLLEKLVKFDKEDYVIDYFERVEAEILLEKETNLQKLLAYYQKQVDEGHARKVKCLNNLKTNKALENELQSIRQTLLEHEDMLKEENYDFLLETLDGDETRWKAIQSECNTLLRKTKSLGEELKSRIIGDHVTSFAATASITQLENMGVILAISIFDTMILCSDKTNTDLVKLCKLNGKQFKMLYRASRDGFLASNFHAKCNNQASTLNQDNKGLHFRWLRCSRLGQYKWL